MKFFTKKIGNIGNRGFTLIELLVVVAIIGFLSSIVLFSVETSREKARDAKRMADLHDLEIAAEIRLLEKTAIPVASIDTHTVSVNEPSLSLTEKTTKVIKFVTLTPEEAEAQSVWSASAEYYDNLFTNGFFKPGTPKPQDPGCRVSQPETCYRAYYNGQTMVFVATLRTKRHSSGYQVQAGAVVGEKNEASFQATCGAIGFPVFDPAFSATDPASCTSVSNGPASVVLGQTNGRDIQGAGGGGEVSY